MPLFDSSRFPWPQRGDINLWADFAERICLFSDGGQLSLEDFKDWLVDDRTKTSEEIESSLNFNYDFLRTVPVAVARQVVNEVEEDDTENENLDAINSKLITLFNFISKRQNVYGLHYPFRVQNNIISLQSQPTNIQKAYIILLMSSDLRIYDAANINRLGHHFEALCEGPFSRLVSNNATVKFFGSGAGTIMRTDYAGNLQTRIRALANDIGLDTTNAIEDPDELSPTGDAGLDWVAWAAFPDQLNHQPLFFGQCACGSNWVDKQHETSLARWRNYFDINQPVHHIHFLPRSFRRINKEWLQKTAIEDVILIDRPRLLFLIEQNDITPILTRYNDLLEETERFLLE
jgi:hypothetical protein